MTRLREWHRRCIDAYSSDAPPLWPIIWPIPDDAGTVRLLAEALLVVAVILVYTFIFVGGLLWLATR